MNRWIASTVLVKRLSSLSMVVFSAKFIESIKYSNLFIQFPNCMYNCLPFLLSTKLIYIQNFKNYYNLFEIVIKSIKKTNIYNFNYLCVFKVRKYSKIGNTLKKNPIVARTLTNFFLL